MNKENSYFSQILKKLHQIVWKLTSFNLKIFSGLLVQKPPKTEIQKSGVTEGSFLFHCGSFCVEGEGYH